MTESEMLQYALREAKKLLDLLERAYAIHDHDSDLHGGIALSAAKLSAMAMGQELTALLMTLKSN
jgi:hypothetical protein